MQCRLRRSGIIAFTGTGRPRRRRRSVRSRRVEMPGRSADEKKGRPWRRHSCAKSKSSAQCNCRRRPTQRAMEVSVICMTSSSSGPADESNHTVRTGHERTVAQIHDQDPPVLIAADKCPGSLRPWARYPGSVRPVAGMSRACLPCPQRCSDSRSGGDGHAHVVDCRYQMIERLEQRQRKAQLRGPVRRMTEGFLDLERPAGVEVLQGGHAMVRGGRA